MKSREKSSRRSLPVFRLERDGSAITHQIPKIMVVVMKMMMLRMMMRMVIMLRMVEMMRRMVGMMRMMRMRIRER